MSVISDPSVRKLLFVAWQESNPGESTAHEEGGFVLRNGDGSFCVERWPRGSQDEILVPDHADGKRNGLTVVATFHTHPNPGPDFMQAPGRADLLNVFHDANLKHAEYEGEFVLAAEWIYLIATSGTVTIVGKTHELLSAE